MFPHVLTVNTAAELSLIDEIVLTTEMRNLMEPCSGVILRCSSNTHVKPLGQLRLYLHLNDLIVPFYFGAMQNFPPKRLVETTFCDHHIENITSTTRRITS